MSWMTAWEFEHSAGTGDVPPLALFGALGSLSALSLMATLAGGYLVSRGGRWSGALQALAAGLLLSVVVVEILPGLELRGTSMWMIEGFACLGLFAFAAVSWAGTSHQQNAHRRSRQIVGWSGAAGFLMHRFFEGAAAGTGLLLDARLAAGILAIVVVHWAAEGAAVATYLSSLPLQARGPAVAVSLTVLAAATLGGALAATMVAPPAAADRAFLAAFCGVLVFTARLTATSAAAVLGTARAYALAAAGAVIFSLAEFAG